MKSKELKLHLIREGWTKLGEAMVDDGFNFGEVKVEIFLNRDGVIENFAYCGYYRSPYLTGSYNSAREAIDDIKNSKNGKNYYKNFSEVTE